MRQIQDTFAIHHERVFTGLFFGNGVRDECVNFLNANPTECIVMQIKQGEWTDIDDNNTKTFQEVLDGYLQGFESFFRLGDHIPTLGEVRGKIVVVRRFSLDPPYDARGVAPLPWKDNATFEVPPYTAANGQAVKFEIQDQYNVPTIFPGDINAKWNAISALLDRAKADESDTWYINFTSGSSLGAYPNAVEAQIYTPLYNYLGGGPFLNRLGTLMLDFPDDNLIGRIIGLNVPAAGTSRRVVRQQAA